MPRIVCGAGGGLPAGVAASVPPELSFKQARSKMRGKEHGDRVELEFLLKKEVGGEALLAATAKPAVVTVACDCARSHFNEGIASHKAGDREAALVSYDRARSFQVISATGSPELARTYSFMGVAYFSQGKFGTARFWFMEASGIQDGLLLALTYRDLGLVSIAENKIDDAISWYEKACKIQEESAPDSADVAVTYYDLGHARYSKGQREESERLYRKALCIQKRKAMDTVRLALTYHSLGLVSRSDKESRECVGNALALYQKNADVAISQGKWEEARDLLDAISEIQETTNRDLATTRKKMVYVQQQSDNTQYWYATVPAAPVDCRPKPRLGVTK